MTRVLLALMAVAFGASFDIPGARAQSGAYPNKPIRFIVPYIPGSVPDVIARVVAPRLGEQLGQQLVIDNRPGAGSNIGNEAAARSAPDGYTIVLATNAVAINQALYSKINIDASRDFAPISLLTRMPHILLVPASSTIKTVPELVAALKADPRMTYASGGNGSGAHLSAEIFKTATQTDAVHVPYKGAPDIINALLTAQTQFGFPTLGTAVPHIKAGKLRALGVTGPKRSPAFPDVPAIGESVPGFALVSWFGVMAPAKTPDRIVERLAAEIGKVLSDPVLRERIQADGTEVVTNTPAEYRAFFKDEMANWARAVKAAGAKVD